MALLQNAHHLFLIGLCINLFFLHIESSDEFDYGMVIDAGSTHSQLFIYQFAYRTSSTSTPPKSIPKQIASSDSEGPVGNIENQYESDELISSLVDFAKQELKEDLIRWNTFPIYLKATAGMRILPNQQREEILGFIDSSFLNKTINPFLFDITQAIIASGEEEATFGWLGVNLIYNTLINNNSDQTTMGALDLGGESTEIAFVANPIGNILADFTVVRLWETNHRLYTHSFLQYGINAIEQRVAQNVYDSSSSYDTVNNPCLNNGTNVTYTVVFKNGTNGPNAQFGSSSGHPYKCGDILRQFLYNNTECLTKSCSINGVYQPKLPYNMTFVAFDAFAYAIQDLNLPNNIDLYEFYYNVTVNICNLTYAELKVLYPNLKDEFLIGTCRLNTYIFTLLYEGYGFNLRNTNIIWTTKQNESVITWTQGSILRDSNWLPYDLIINTTTTLPPLKEIKECEWIWSDGKHILNISSIIKKSLSIVNKHDTNLFYTYSPCANTMLCDNNIYAMAGFMNSKSFECDKYFAIWENGKTQPKYDQLLKMWRFVYNNGEKCDGIEGEFIVNWWCDQSAVIPQIVRADQIEPCLYIMDVNATFACE